MLVVIDPAAANGGVVFLQCICASDVYAYTGREGDASNSVIFVILSICRIAAYVVRK